jgi:hypothetical protein
LFQVVPSGRKLETNKKLKRNKARTPNDRMIRSYVFFLFSAQANSPNVSYGPNPSSPHAAVFAWEPSHTQPLHRAACTNAASHAELHVDHLIGIAWSHSR